MSVPALPCQTPSRDAIRVGDSGLEPPEHGENVFVADEAVGVLDTPTRMDVSLSALTACIQTTRYVGTVDAAGFLTKVADKVREGTITSTLVLTVRAQIFAVDAGGLLGRDGLDVEVVLHRGTTKEFSLGKIEGSFLADWLTYELDVPIEHVRFPDDPCSGQSPEGLCGKSIVPKGNDVSFVFTGQLPAGITVDWMSLHPKNTKDIAARPVMLVHGWDARADTWRPDSVWPERLLQSDIPFHAISIPPDGTVAANGAEISRRVPDLVERFGVDKLIIVAHSKGGVDSREHVRHHNDVEKLVMIATPNAGSVWATPGAARDAALPSRSSAGVSDMSHKSMQRYNTYARAAGEPNLRTTYLTASGNYDSPWARRLALTGEGPNDEAVGTASVESLQFPSKTFSYLTSTTEAISQGICAEREFKNHSCLLYRQQIMADMFEILFDVRHEEMFVQSPVTEVLAQATPAEVEDFETGLQSVTSASGVAGAGETVAFPIVLDAMSHVFFAVRGAPAALDVALLTPSGNRIDVGTSDPAVVIFETFTDLGPASFTGIAVAGPEAGTYTLEVTGTGGASADGAAFDVNVFAPLDVGVVLDARLEDDLATPGEPLTILATLTEDGVPVTGATVHASVLRSDGTVAAVIVLRDEGAPDDAQAGDGVYTGVFADTAPGSYVVAVTASRAEPAFTREQVLPATVSLGTTDFSGAITDRGVDLDGDGLIDQLVVDVGVSSDITADYRLYGTLTHAPSATTIEQLRVEASLDPGSGSIPLAFDTARLTELALDGPYLVTGLALEEVATGTVVALGPEHTTAAYAISQFQRPALVATGVSADRGANDADKPRVPFEDLIVEMEIDALAAALVDATARLRAPDGTLIAVPSVHQAHLPAGRSLLAFSVPATQIFLVGQPGPYTLEELTVWGTLEAAPGSPVELVVPGVNAITQPYAIDDFGPSPVFTVGGTVSGLAGVGLKVREVGSGVFGADQRLTANGPFTIAVPELVSGIPYRVEVTTQPINPVQQCVVVNGAGTIEDGNVTDVVVQCSPAQADERA